MIIDFFSKFYLLTGRTTGFDAGIRRDYIIILIFFENGDVVQLALPY